MHFMHILHSWGIPLNLYTNCVFVTHGCANDEFSVETGHIINLEEITELTTAAGYICGCVIMI